MNVSFKEFLPFSSVLRAKLLWSEVSLLERLRYKNRNQHGSGGYFKKLLLVLRGFSRLKKLSWETLVPSNAPADLNSFLKLALERLLSGYALCEFLKPVIVDAYTLFRHEVSQTHFMAPFMVIMGSLARCHFLLGHLTGQACKFYNVLISLAHERGIDVSSYPLTLGRVLDSTQPEEVIDDVEKEEEPVQDTVINWDLEGIPDISDSFWTRND